MNINATEELERVLGEIEAKIKHLESSPNRAFVLVEYDTLNLFHWFNECFKKFWDEFNHTTSQLLLFRKFTKLHSELSDRYVALFREQIDYLEDVIDFGHNMVKELPPVIFSEDNRTDVIGYYMERFKDETDENGKPLYIIDVDRDTNYEVINGKNVSIDFYMFRSDELNNKHYKGLFNMYDCLSSLYPLISTVCSYPKVLQLGYQPSEEEIIYTLDCELRKHAKEDGQSIYRELRKIFLELKRTNNQSQSSNVWAQVLEVEDDAFRLAIAGKLIEKKERLFDHYDEDKRKFWTDNYKLLQKIKDTCIDDELFDVKLAVETYNLLSVLSADNLDLFCELVLRRNIIHSEMFPELKAQYEEWLNRVNEQPEESRDNELSEARKSKLDEIIEILQKGNWKLPATAENIKQLLNTIFGRNMTLLEDGDEQLCEAMWAFVESGTGNRMEVVPANLAGFFLEENLLNGSPKTISDDLFGKNNNQTNNINKGNSSRRSNAFREVIPFLTKYTNKIIRKA